jgi:hypothetical protein
MKCEICKKKFEPTRKNQTVCSNPDCKKKKEKQYQAEYYTNKLKGDPDRLKRERERYHEKKKDTEWYKKKIELTPEQKERKREYNRERYRQKKLNKR